MSVYAPDQRHDHRHGIFGYFGVDEDGNVARAQQLLWIRLTKRRLEMVVVIHCGFCGRRSVSLANGEQAYTTGSIAHLSKDI